MTKGFLISGVVALVVASSAGAQQESDTPAPDQIEQLAELWSMRSMPGVLGAAFPSDARVLEDSLLQSHYVPRGRPCDPSHPQCRAVAQDVARRWASENRRLREQINTILLERRLLAIMSSSEVEKAIAFLETDAGLSFAEAVNGIDDLDYTVLYQELAQAGELPQPIDSSVYWNDFYDRTAELPRAPQRPLAPPPRPFPPDDSQQ